MARLAAKERIATRAYWRRQCALWEQSGLSQRAFCSMHGLSYKTFCNWKGELKRLDAAGPDARWGKYPRLRDLAETQRALVDPSARPSAVVVERIAVGVEVDLPDGTRIRFDRSVSASRIRSIISVLENRLPNSPS